MNGRWNFVGPDDINCSSQPAMRALGKVLSSLKKNTTKVPDLIQTAREIYMGAAIPMVDQRHGNEESAEADASTKKPAKIPSDSKAK